MLQYEGYMDVLYAMIDRVAVGGFIIADDYRCVENANNATDEFRYVLGAVCQFRYVLRAG